MKRLKYRTLIMYVMNNGYLYIKLLNPGKYAIQRSLVIRNVLSTNVEAAVKVDSYY